MDNDARDTKLRLSIRIGGVFLSQSIANAYSHHQKMTVIAFDGFQDDAHFRT